MTQDEISTQDIIEMAIEVYGSAHADDIKFAKLVAAKEREANRSYIHELEYELEVAQDKINEYLVAEYQRTKAKTC
jgi:siroheme synthase